MPSLAPWEREEVITGFWGKHTATIDWCEYNYEVTNYVAEFWNTVSNLFMILPPLHGIYSCYKFGYEFRFVVSFLALLSIGLGSWIFHMTLRYDAQLLDEIPMVFGAAALTYCIYHVRKPPGQESLMVAVLLFAYACVFIGVYLVIDKPLFQEWIYGLLAFAMIVLDLELTIKQRSRSNTFLFVLGLVLYMTGFGLWNLEIAYCSKVRQVRASLPPPVAPITQLHAWWHIMAGYTGYIQTVSVLHNRLRFLKRPYSYALSPVGLTVVTTNDGKSD